jgi:predicted PurR-regulated permease PerM
MGELSISLIVITIFISLFFISIIFLITRFITKKKVSRNTKVLGLILVITLVIIFIFTLFILIFEIIAGFYLGNPLTSSTAEQVTRTSELLSMRIEIMSANWSNGSVIAVVKNTGPVDTKVENAFVDNVLSKINTSNLSLKPDEIVTLIILNATKACNSKLNIVIQSGLESQSNITC